MCPKCKKKIVWYDNIPIISYLVLMGKCRHCRRSISIQYPLIELTTASTFLFVSFFSGPGRTISQWINELCVSQAININSHLSINILLLIILLTVCSFLILIAVYDLKTKEIPNGFNLGFIFFALLYTIFITIDSSVPLGYFALYPLTAIVAFLFFHSIVYISKETWMGGGDAKLAIGMGLLLGPAHTFIAVFMASWLGAIYGIILIILKKAGRKTEIPFGPFLVLGTLVSLLFGSQLISWYAKMFLGL